MLYTIVLALPHHLFTCICPSIYYYSHILITCTHTYIHCIFPAFLHNCYATSSPNPVLYANLTYPVPYLSSSVSPLPLNIALVIPVHIHTPPRPPGDLTLPYLPPYITFHTYFNILPPPLSTPVPVPLWPPSSLGIVSMPTIINGWACMYASLPG